MKIKVFGKQGCAKCESTKNKFNHFIQKNNHADIAEFRVLFQEFLTVT